MCCFAGKEKTHKHKQIRGIVPGLGGCQNVVYVLFWGHSLWGRKRKKHINKVPPPKKIARQSRENFVYVSFSLCVFFCRSQVSGALPWGTTAPLKRPIKRSMISLSFPENARKRRSGQEPQEKSELEPGPFHLLHFTLPSGSSFRVISQLFSRLRFSLPLPFSSKKHCILASKTLPATRNF